MSIRPEPSPPPCWAAPPDDELDELDELDDELDELDDEADGRGASLASAARLPSENSTEFSLRSPRSFLSPAALSSAAAIAPEPAVSVAAGAEAPARAPNRSPASSPASSV